MVIGGRSIRSHERQPGDKRQPGDTNGNPEATRGHRVNHGRQPGDTGSTTETVAEGIIGSSMGSPGGHRSPNHRGDTGHRGTRSPVGSGSMIIGGVQHQVTRTATRQVTGAHGNPGTQRTATRGHTRQPGDTGATTETVAEGITGCSIGVGWQPGRRGGSIVIGGAIKTQHRVRRECQGGRPKNC